MSYVLACGRDCAPRFARSASDMALFYASHALFGVFRTSGQVAKLMQLAVGVVVIAARLKAAQLPQCRRGQRCPGDCGVVETGPMSYRGRLRCSGLPQPIPSSSGRIECHRLRRRPPTDTALHYVLIHAMAQLVRTPRSKPPNDTASQADSTRLDAFSNATSRTNSSLPYAQQRLTYVQAPPQTNNHLCGSGSWWA